MEEAGPFALGASAQVSPQGPKGCSVGVAGRLETLSWPR